MFIHAMPSMLRHPRTVGRRIGKTAISGGRPETMASSSARPLPALLLAALAAVGVGVASGDEVRVEGRVAEVTVYQGQALVTRAVALPDDGVGLRDIVITGLPDQIIPASLYAEPGAGLEVRSVRYRTRPVEEDVREEVRALDLQLRSLADAREEIQRRRQLVEQREVYLQNLEGFTTGTARLEWEHGVLDAKTVETVTGFVFAKREDDMVALLELATEDRRLGEEIELLQRKREKITQGSAKTVREAVVFLRVEQPGASLRLRYLVAGATWTPSYNLRADGDRKHVVVEYNASVQQMSGEDWQDVAMTLSTATPSLLATPPRLDPLAIRLGDGPAAGGPKVAVDAEEYERLRRELGENRDRLSRNRSQMSQMQAGQLGDQAFEASGGQSQAAGMGGGMGGMAHGRQADGAVAFDEGINFFANELQILDFNSKAAAAGKKGAAAPPSEGVSVSYKLAAETSLPSRSDQQLIQIARQSLDGEFFRVATPVLTSYVYEQARLVNTGDLVLLAGPAATFVGEEFVGRGEVPTVAVGESFAVGLGIDSSLRATRELVSKQETIQGGNRVVDFVYRLELENFGSAPTDVRLIDRIPVVAEDDIKITLVRSDQEPADYEGRAADRKNGIVRWNLAAAAGRTAVEYTLRVEYDKELSVVGMPQRR